MSGLQKRFPKVGFIKPVGQQHVTVYSPTLDKDIRVDKDICLLKEQFHLDHIDYRHMSPVIIPRGYTNSTKQPKQDAWLWLKESFPGIADHLLLS